jgi:hypothetical protein
MSDLMNEFKSESRTLIGQMVEILELCESGAAGPVKLETFGQLADRIMGAAKILEVNLGDQAGQLASVAQFTQLCKLLGYKCAQLSPGSGLWPVSVPLLLDATEELRMLVEGLDEKTGPPVFRRALLDRLAWLNEQFGSDIDGGVPVSSSGKFIDPLYVEDLVQGLKKKT